MIKLNSYFSVCSACGCTEWYEIVEPKFLFHNDNLFNLCNLKSDGTIFKTFNKIKDILSIECMCANCEKENLIIPFNKVSKKEREKLVQMTPEERINWIKGYEVVLEIEKSVKKEDI